MAFTESFYGYIETTTDTLLVFEACRRGILPKINRRLQEKERSSIRSGTIFVFDERESGIKRWTDGLIWSPSRILGNFLIYRELDGRNNNNSNNNNNNNQQHHLKRSSDPATYYHQPSLLENDRYDVTTSVFPHVSPRSSFDQETHYRERALLGSLTTSYRFKSNGLIKKTMSIVLNGSHLHLISYYNKDDVLNNKLPTPSTTPQLANLHISPDMIQRQSFRVSPLLESRLSHLYMNENNMNMNVNGGGGTTSPTNTSGTSSPYMGINPSSSSTTSSSNGRDPYYFNQHHHYHHHQQQQQQQQQMKSLPSPSTSPCSTNSLNTMLNHHQQQHPHHPFMKPDDSYYSSSNNNIIGQKRKERSISPNSLDLNDDNNIRKYSKTHMSDVTSLRSSFSSIHDKIHTSPSIHHPTTTSMNNNNNMISSSSTSSSDYMIYGTNNNNNNNNNNTVNSSSPITSNYALPSNPHSHHPQQQQDNKMKLNYLPMNDQYQHPLDNSLPSPRSNPDHHHHHHQQQNIHMTTTPTTTTNEHNHSNNLLDNSMVYFNSTNPNNNNNNNNNITRTPPPPQQQSQHPLYTRDTSSYPQSPSTPTSSSSHPHTHHLPLNNNNNNSNMQPISNYSAFSPPPHPQTPTTTNHPTTPTSMDHYNRHVYHPSVRHSIVHPSSSFLPSPF